MKSPRTAVLMPPQSGSHDDNLDMSRPSRSPLMFLYVVLLLVTSPAIGLAGVHLGVEAGLNLMSSRYDDFQVHGWTTSFTGGAFLEVPLRGRLALTTGLRYVEQGDRRAVGFDTHRLVQKYLSVPVLLECRPLPSRRFFVSLGPEIGLLLSGRDIREVNQLTGGIEENNSITGRLRRTNLSLDIGTGFEFPMENHLGVLSLRYTHGLTGVAKNGAYVSDWKTRGVEWLIGMRW